MPEKKFRTVGNGFWKLFYVVGTSDKKVTPVRLATKVRGQHFQKLRAIIALGLMRKEAVSARAFALVGRAYYIDFA